MPAKNGKFSCLLKIIVEKTRFESCRHPAGDTLLHRLKPRLNDTPATLGKLFMNDRNYWQSISMGLAVHQQKLVNAHLQQFGSEPLSFVQAADERIAAAED